ncbi:MULTISPECIES: Lrp/AsnC family transcriptional regulator [unclassified Leisingera]|uniref:Lrp/AsnC family transcriptional regulator n=1 Tax=unclassified Leisingera TaxID=2614906 RepID=UPI0003080CDF|nr:MULTISPECIES: Lrp/AsnC family transcriptional regulator [unclassified Leisingera]KIC14530.1 ArsR family transcriptional regulator [Leisingera sp. ANG-DT]KIC24068.1 ArsR family transcriptional regulator [Leisingera sp. ANG-S3]KIC28127.1 ArsR family transcriptional regulator [Leisingera sp. ANG-M6]KIC31211.1 ArsR family transcriptional regulator [Leisingera sp. ANG-S5]KIC52506.1 ArsR family transcriptional regulator [Leisingera sp. ANG-S]
MTTNLDEADLTILRLLQKDCRIGLEQLAQECSLSVPSVQRRLKKLRESDLIQQEVAILNPARFSYKMTFVVLVELDRESLDQLDHFRKRAKADPQVQQCYYVTGDADFILICTAQDMQDFEALTHRLFFENSNVRRFRTSVAMERTKVGMALPI